MQVACARGCGFTVDIPHEEIEAAIHKNETLTFSHEPGECPVDPEEVEAASVDKPEYQVIVVVNRKLPDAQYPQRLARSGRKVHGDSLADIFETLSDELVKAWAEIEKMHTIAEQGD